MSSDEIRAKRLARLGAVATPANNTSGTSGNEPTVLSSPVVSSSRKDLEVDSGKITSCSEKQASSPKKSVAAPSPPKPSPVVQNLPEEVVHDWMNLMLEQVFQATLDSSDKSNKLVFLSSLSDDLQSTGLLLNEDHLESIFMEILTGKGIPSNHATPLEYLYSIYHKAYGEKKKAGTKSKIANFEENYQLIHFVWFYLFPGPRYVYGE
jgi:ubiquitin conjugation factor E4 B